MLWWRSFSKGVWRAPKGHLPASIVAWLLLQLCFGMPASAPMPRSQYDPAPPHALSPAPAPPVPPPQQGDRAQHGHRENLSVHGPCPSKGLLSPSLWYCSCPSSVEHGGGRNKPLRGPRAGQAWGGAGTPQSLGLKLYWEGSSLPRVTANLLPG